MWPIPYRRRQYKKRPKVKRVSSYQSIWFKSVVDLTMTKFPAPRQHLLGITLASLLFQIIILSQSMYFTSQAQEKSWLTPKID